MVVVATIAACNPSNPTAAVRPMDPAAARSSAATRYIVQSGNEPRGFARQYGITPRHVYTRTLRGFSADLTEGQVAALRRSGAVVTPVRMVRAATEWNLDRIDQHALPLDNAPYTPMNHGAGVTVYMIDSGIDLTHSEFAGRVRWGANFVDGINTDCSGHGTATAGSAGGSTVGVANAVQLVAIKVLDCAAVGPNDGVVAGIEWAVADHSGPSVLNLSLVDPFGGPVPPDDPMVVAVENAYAAGVLSTVAAGNDNVDACSYTPAAAPHALTIASSVIVNTFPKTDGMGISNGGPCVDLFAPGTSVLTSALGGGYAVQNGTSIAAPHVAGAAAMWLSSNPAWTPLQVSTAILANASPTVVSNVRVPGTTSLLLYVGGVAPPPPPNDAAFTTSCSLFSCTFTGTQSGAWTFGDGGTALGAQVSHTFAKRQQAYLVTHTVGASVATDSVKCWPKKCS